MRDSAFRDLRSRVQGYFPPLWKITWKMKWKLGVYRGITLSHFESCVHPVSAHIHLQKQLQNPISWNSQKSFHILLSPCTLSFSYVMPTTLTVNPVQNLVTLPCKASCAPTRTPAEVPIELSKFINNTPSPRPLIRTPESFSYAFCGPGAFKKPLYPFSKSKAT